MLTPRITSGTAKNKRLKAPKIAGFRAVQEIVKLATFSILGEEKVRGSTCLDLYAGSGNMGLEALSRGAGHCDFVDHHRLSERAILENIKNCNLLEKAEVFCADAVKYVAETPQKYDIIFVDPFYNEISHKFLMQNIYEILNDNGIVIFTHGKNLDIKSLLGDLSFEIYTQRRFGASYLSILTKNSNRPS